GSVTKVQTIGVDLHVHVLTADQRFTVADSTRVADSVFHDAEGHPTQSMSVSDILAQSSNVETIGIAQQLGKDKLGAYLRAFGLGKRTGLGFPGEAAGLLLNPAHESGTDIATVPIGQGEAVTAVQMLDAYDAVANGGSFVPPRLVRATTGLDGAQHPAPRPQRHRGAGPADPHLRRSGRCARVRPDSPVRAASPGHPAGGSLAAGDAGCGRATRPASRAGRAGDAGGCQRADEAPAHYA